MLPAAVGVKVYVRDVALEYGLTLVAPMLMVVHVMVSPEPGENDARIVVDCPTLIFVESAEMETEGGGGRGPTLQDRCGNEPVRFPLLQVRVWD